VIYKSPSTVPAFNNAQILAYFVTRTVSDRLQCGDFKSVSQSAVDLFRCGHVQQVEASSGRQSLWIRAKCLPQMKKDRIYKLLLSLNYNSFDIIHAQCECPAGKGPTATCKHIGALCYTFQNFCEHGMLPNFLTCTQKLQEWNRPRPRKVDPIPVVDIRSHQHAIRGTPLKRSRNPRTPSEFDPRPLHMRSPDPDAVDRLRADLLLLGQPSALLTILVPTVEKALHDHTYCKQDGSPRRVYSPPVISCPYTSEELQALCTQVEEGLVVNSEERRRIEQMTRLQSSCPFWHEVRYKRITGWKCGQILSQKSKTPALLRRLLYHKPFFPLPVPIKWGHDNEPVARQAYISFMQDNGHPYLTVSPCGFIVHPQEGWLGVSPDGMVTESPNELSKGLLEIKCPFSKRDVLPKIACKDPSFYCFLSDDESLRLKRDHQYYHQVQLQLFVCSDMCQWCDFCVYTTKGVMVERLYQDVNWIEEYIPQLRDYYVNFMLPELVYPMCKPSYFL